MMHRFAVHCNVCNYVLKSTMVHRDELSRGENKQTNKHTTLFSLIFQPVSFILTTGELDVGQTIGNSANSRYMKGSLSYVIAFSSTASGCTCRHQSTC